jgi:hypothetical protein
MFLATMSFVCTTHASVVKLDYWNFDTDTSGKTFGTSTVAGWANSGSNGSLWNNGAYTPGKAEANGNGSLLVSGQAGAVFRKVTGTGSATAGQYATPYTTGAYRIELNFAGWNLAGTGPNSNNSIQLLAMPNEAAGTGGVAGIRLDKYGATAARVQLFSNSTASGNQENFLSVNFGLVETTAQSFAIEFDYASKNITYLRNGTIIGQYTNFLGAADGPYTVTSNVGSDARMGSLQFSTSSNWNADNTVNIDSMGFSQIPEPSTGSMILLGMGGLAAVRLLRRKVS